jgi:cell wall-associated NlpC family hydrolase
MKTVKSLYEEYVSIMGEDKVTDDPKPLDVVLFAHGKKRHIGLYIGNNKMLHTVEGKDSCVDRINYATLSGFYRHCSCPSVTFR